MLTLWLFLVGGITPVYGDDQRTATVGMTARIDQLVLPGSELVARPIDDRSVPVVLRIVDTYPHGTAFRYDLVYYGLEPGEYNLAGFLIRKDGSSMENVPEVRVKIEPVLPPGQIAPNELAVNSAPVVGGYRIWLSVGAVLWFVGLAVILLAGRNRVRARASQKRVVTLADRLRPLVEKARRGELQKTEQAELERMLLEYWRKRLDLETETAAQAIARLRQHEQAGPLLRRLEQWLHRPDGGEDVDLEALLEPYRQP